jgi:hypothetical protein
MTDFQYLEKGIHFLFTIIRQRRWLLNHKFSQLPSLFTQEEVKNIEYAKSIIRTGHSMKDYLERKKDTLAILISAVNRKCHDDLDTLTKTKINQSII